jgi:ribonucleoside-triphosphate reductase
MNNTQKILSDIVVYNKYAKYSSIEKRRETWQEIVERYITMMVKRYGAEGDHEIWKHSPKVTSLMSQEIIKNGKDIMDKNVLPSMRALQFAGPAIEKNEARGYNCSYMPMDDYRGFSELMFLLLGGTGAGYSVQRHHVEKLPEIHKPTKESKYLIGDSIEGWADAVKQLMKAYFGITKVKPRFDYSDIREKGSMLITAGGKAPGPEPLKIALVKIESILNEKENGTKLTPFEVHRICCLIADAVLAGGIRRAALISLFSMEDKMMLTCKHGNWWEKYPELGRANNSATILRNRVKKHEFDTLWKIIVDSNSGEPGIYFTNDPEYGTNPCCEI